MTTYIKNSSTVESETGSLKHARIGYQTYARTLIPTASSEAEGFPAIAARNDDTYEYWRPTEVPAWWQVDLGEARSINYVGIAAHNIGSVGARVTVQHSSDGSTWDDANDASVAPSSVAPTTDGAMLFLFPAVSARYWRLYVEDVIPTIGVVFIGGILAMQRGFYVGHSPVTLSRQTVIRPTVSERGQWLGRSVIRSGLKTSVSWKNLTATWYRENFDPFVSSARSYPFFFAWRPSEFPAELAYASCDSDIAPDNSGPKSYMSVGFTLSGAGYE